MFEGVVVNSKVDHYVPHFSDAESDNPRVQLAPHSIGAAYTTQYQEQLRNIIEGYDVFVGDEEPVKFDHKATKRQKQDQNVKLIIRLAIHQHQNFCDTFRVCSQKERTEAPSATGKQLTTP